MTNSNSSLKLQASQLKGNIMKVYKYKSYEYWYDRSYKTWFAIKVDAFGNQIGNAIDAYTKQDIVKYIDLELV